MAALAGEESEPDNMDDQQNGATADRENSLEARMHPLEALSDDEGSDGQTVQQLNASHHHDNHDNDNNDNAQHSMLQMLQEQQQHQQIRLEQWRARQRRAHGSSPEQQQQRRRRRARHQQQHQQRHRLHAQVAAGERPDRTALQSVMDLTETFTSGALLA